MDLQEGRDPDYSEYKEFKLTVENLGFRMLMKMGWKEGEGLGNEGQGIKDPVNKWVFSHKFPPVVTETTVGENVLDCLGEKLVFKTKKQSHIF